MATRAGTNMIAGTTNIPPTATTIQSTMATGTTRWGRARTMITACRKAEGINAP